MANDPGNDASLPDPAMGPPSGPPADWLVLLDRIEAEVRRLERHRQVWRSLLPNRGSAPNLASAPNGGFAGRAAREPASGDTAWLAGLYFRDQALGIRRMVDGDRRAGSFKRLLHKMTGGCILLTRDWFVHSRSGADDAAAEFARLADPWHSGHLDSEVPRSDLRTLETACNGIKRYVDQYVTHAQLDPDAGIPGDSDVDDALNVLLQLLGKYTLLLRPDIRDAGSDDVV